MANSPESEGDWSGDQLKMSYSIRDRLITDLNQMSTILQCNEPIPGDAKQRTCKKIEQSILLLVSLSPFEATQLNEESDEFEERISEQLIAELSREDRSKILNHLIGIKDALLFGHKISRAAKDSLVTENRRIIIEQLLGLPCKVESNMISGAGSAVVKSEDKNENSGEPSAKKQRVESEPNEALDRLKAATKVQEGQISSLEARMNELKREIKCITITRAEVSFRFELADVSKFLENDGISEYYSGRFWCRGLQWSVRCYSGKRSPKYLFLFLHCHDEDTQSLCCKVHYDLILFSHLSENQNKVFTSTRTFPTNNFSYSKCISHSELTDAKNGYLKGDKILLGVELKVGPVVRQVAGF